jgi:hypothetical protein
MERTPKEDFDLSLGRVRALAEHIQSDSSLDSKSMALRETQQCGAIVLLSGYLEAFLKASLKKFIERICESGVAFSALPPAIQQAHYRGGAELLKSVAVGPSKGRHKGLTREDLVSRLSSVTGSSYKIVWEAFADTGANPNPEQVQRMAKKVGVTAPKQRDLWGMMHQESGASVEFAGGTLKAKLTDLVEKRNECAHTGTVYPVPTAMEIIEYTEVLSVIGQGFTILLEKQLGALRPQEPGE